jgi:hypothetical protein
VILRRLKTGTVVPFLGAGASMVGRTPEDRWNPQAPKFLPSGSELSRLLAEESRFPSPEEQANLSRVASYYEDIDGRDGLRQRLREIFAGHYAAGALHAFLASLAAPLVIVVTNYDTLLEEAFLAAGRAYDLVVHPADRKDFASAVLWWRHGQELPLAVAPNELDIDLSTTTVIYKMHGSIHPRQPEWDNFVVTEEDYVDFLSRMTANVAVPALFHEHFRERSFLFLGYSLNDWNLRVLLKNIRRRLTPWERGALESEEGRPSWAIQYRPSPLDLTLWKRRNVEIYDLPIDNFVTGIQAMAGSR